MNFEFEFLQDWEIPLPPIEVQQEIVAQIERQQAIIEGADKILKIWQIEVEESHEKRILNEFITDSLYGISTKLDDVGNLPVLRMNNLDTKGIWNLSDLKYISEPIPEQRKLEKGDFLFNRTNSIELVGKSGVVDFDFDGTYAGYLIRIRLNQEKLSPYYLRYLFATNKYKKYFSSIAKPAGGQANINAEELANTPIDYFSMDKQKEIISRCNSDMETIDGIRQMKTEAQAKIDKLINSIWESS